MEKYIAWEFEGIIIMAQLDMVAGYYGRVTDADQEGEKTDARIAIEALSMMISDKIRRGAISERRDEGSFGIIEIDMPEIEPTIPKQQEANDEQHEGNNPEHPQKGIVQSE